jgi:hypothetical protein
MKGRSRLPLDQGGEVVHAMSAGREFRGHVLALAVTRFDEGYASKVRHGLGKVVAAAAARNRCCFPALAGTAGLAPGDRQLRGMWNSVN